MELVAIDRSNMTTHATTSRELPRCTNATRHHVYCRYTPKIHLYTTRRTRRARRTRRTRRYLRSTSASSSTNIASSNNTIGADTALGHQRFLRHIHYDPALDDGRMPDTETEITHTLQSSAGRRWSGWCCPQMQSRGGSRRG
jgi:hypothetical protein